MCIKRIQGCVLLIALLFPPLLGQPEESPVAVYPQMVVGGGFSTILQLTNASGRTWAGTLRLPEFGSGSGIGWMLNGVDQTGLEDHSVELGPWSTQSFVFVGTGGQEAAAGSLWVEPAAGTEGGPLASTFFFRFEIDGELVDEVWAPPARSEPRVVFPVELHAGLSLNTGLAVRGEPNLLATQGQGSTGAIRAILLDQQGILLEEVTNVPRGAQFIDQLFDFPFGDSFLGAVVLEGSDAYYVTALRQRLLPAGRFQLTGIAPAATPEVPPAAQTARYRVTFEATWSSGSHPDSFPTGAHFSPLVGGTHSSEVVFWEEGGFATIGIERMAETGSTSSLLSEVQTAVNAGTAGGTLLRPLGSSSPDLVSFEFDIDRSFPLVSLVTMIAPSPDWFVGVTSLPLFENGRWKSEIVVQLAPYDAGTDSGLSYASPDQDTQPHVPIREIIGAPFLNQGVVLPLGTFTFEQIRTGN